MVDVEAREAAALPIYLHSCADAVCLLHAPSPVFLGLQCSGPVRFPPPQGRKATGPQGHRVEI